MKRAIADMKPALRIPRPGLARLQTRRLHTYLHPPGEADDAEPHIFYNTDELPILGSSPAASRQRRIHSIPLRTGALAIKKGMMAMYDKETGIRTPCTVLQMDRVEVVDCKTMGLHGYFAVQVGAGLKHHTNVTRPELGHFARCGVSPKRFLAEFQVRDERGLIRSGTMLHPSWFLVGQFVDARANCRGMGFAGVSTSGPAFAGCRKGGVPAL